MHAADRRRPETAARRLTVRWEKLDAVLAAGADDLAQAHWEEAENDKDVIPLDLDLDALRTMERIGVLRIAALYAGDRLAGYANFQVTTHVFHRTALHAFNDGVFVDPAFRGRGGLTLIREAEKMLVEIGVRRIYYASKPHVLGARGKSATLGTLLGRLGYKHAETVYSKVIQ